MKAHKTSYTRYFLAAAWGLAAVFLSPAGLRAESWITPPDFELRLDLLDGLFQETPEPGSPTLAVHLARTGDRWERVWGDAMSFNKQFHEGRVVAATVEKDRITLELAMKINADAWVRGGTARYRVDLVKKDGDLFEGTHQGVFRGQEVKGVARGRVFPAQTQDPDRKPVTTSEHPRLLFRAADLPALKAKAATPFGKQALEGMTGVAGKAFRALLEGNKDAALALIPEIEPMMQDVTIGDKRVRGRVHGWRMEQIALAYDFCYGFWPEDFRKRVENYVGGNQGIRPFRAMPSFQKEISWNNSQIYPPAIRYGSALAALAVAGAPGPEPARPPASPFTHAEPITAVDPAAGLKVEDHLVSLFESGKRPLNWICAGGYKPADMRRVMEGFDGAATLRPKTGDSFTVADRTHTFRPVEKFYNDQIAVTDAAKREFNTVTLFYSVVRNDSGRLARFMVGAGNYRAWLNGVEFRHGDIVRLAPGLYPIMVAVFTGQQSAWGNDLARPHFVELTQEEADQLIAETKKTHEETVAMWEFDLEQWKRTGGADVSILKLFELSRYAMRAYFRDAAGEGGRMAAPLISLEGPARYAAAYRNAAGFNLSAGRDADHILPQMVFNHVYGETGPGVGRRFNGAGILTSERFYQEPPYPLASTLFAPLFSASDVRFRSVLLWAWRRELGIGGPEDAAKVLSEPSRQLTGYQTDPNRLWAFVNYEPDGAARPPAGILPLTWRADGQGWYGFRNRWKDADDFLVEFNLRAGIHGGEEAGAFRVRGLGRDWAFGGSRMRLLENVVQLGENALNESGRGRLLHYESRPDGSGSITIDLSDVYAKPSPGLYDAGRVRRPARLVPSGVTGTRSLAVDYSGKSGVPCLLVIVDKIEGGKGEFWFWPTRFTREKLPSARQKYTEDLIIEGKKYQDYTQAELKAIHLRIVEALKKAKKPDPKKNEDEEAEEDEPGAGQGLVPELDEKGFVVRDRNAVLRATFVTPSDVKPGLEDVERFTLGDKFGFSRYACQGVTLHGRGSYMVVVTIGTGEPPAVKTTGQGLETRVEVGGQTVRYDGKSIIFGP